MYTRLLIVSLNNCGYSTDYKCINNKHIIHGMSEKNHLLATTASTEQIVNAITEKNIFIQESVRVQLIPSVNIKSFFLEYTLRM